MQVPPSASVMGIRDFGPVEGTPLIPPSYLTAYFGVFLLFLTLIYVYLYHKRKPELRWHKIRLLIVTALILKITLIGGGALLAAYWIIPAPAIRRTTPVAQATQVGLNSPIEIVLDRPVSRGTLEKSITPEVPGRWVFEDSIYTTHLYRRLVFYPEQSLSPDTKYTVKLSHIQNIIKRSEAYEFEFDFTTQPTPLVKSVSPQNAAETVDTNAYINVALTQPNENVSEFNFFIDPPISFQTKLDESSTSYTLIPQNPLKQGTTYTVSVQKTDIKWNLEEAVELERGETQEVYKGAFKTKEAPGILSFEPGDTNASVNSDIKIHFSQKMNKKSVEDNFVISPKTNGNITWTDEQTLVFKPLALTFDTEYQVRVKIGTRSLEGFLEEDIVKTFKTIGPVNVMRTSPQNNVIAINVQSPISFTFDQEVDHASVESKFSIAPNVKGTFKWDRNTVSFIPSEHLTYSAIYSVSFASGIKSINGQNSKQEFKLTFTTQNTTTKLAVPAYLQKYTLSCEIASLRMALNYRGANVSEDELIPKVGLDTTPHNGDTWGNPNVGFVGNIAGTQMANGYGVHWAPIAKAARNYRDAKDFQGYTIAQLTHELNAGNPVIIWVYSHFGTKTTWKTPDGTLIYAVRDEHAVVVVGYVGTAENPTQLIINDPLTGQVYWSRANFDKKWNIFGNSGVVIY